MTAKDKKPVKVSLRSSLVRLSADFGWYVIPVPAESVKVFAFEKANRRVICTINAAETIQCALMPYNGDFFIMVNKQIRNRLGLKEGDSVKIELQKDESKYGLPMPPELREVLRQDRDGDRLFHALTKGRQRSIIYYVSKIKDIDRRIHAAIVFIEHLKKNDGGIDQTSLQSELKRPVIT